MEASVRTETKGQTMAHESSESVMGTLAAAPAPALPKEAQTHTHTYMYTSRHTRVTVKSLYVPSTLAFRKRLNFIPPDLKRIPNYSCDKQH